MLQKALIGCIFIILILVFSLRITYKDLKATRESNKILTATLEANIKAMKDKEERNTHELERLQKKLTDLSRLNDACLSSPVTDDLISFLQQLQQDSAGTISFTFTK